VIPSGTFVWNGTLSITNSLILKGQGSTSTFIQRASGFTGQLIIIQPSSDVPVRVTGINFNEKSIGQNGRLECVAVYGPQGGDWGLSQIRVDNCAFTGGMDDVEWNFYAAGVVDHCTFLNCPYAVVAYADNDYAFQRPTAFGQNDAVYVENCSFTMDSNIGSFDQITDTDFGGRMVFRYCTVDLTKVADWNFGAVWETHGNQSYWTGNQNQDLRGTVSMEIYDNTVKTSPAYRITYLRGGRVLVFNNHFTFANNVPVVNMTEEEGYDGPGGNREEHDWFNPLRKSWPAEDQVNNSFFWNNTVNGSPQKDTDFALWNDPPDRVFVQQGRDYWTVPPSISTLSSLRQPGAPSRPNYPMHPFYDAVTSYHPFTYPHPLTTSGFTGN
jgi:hypothetical protein